jgi:glycosyltransferase involved in cell wall biosynthesis
VQQPKPTPKLTVVIKTLNEATKIEACLRSVLAATDPASTEIIVADSLSEDDTVRVAAQFAIKVVQLASRDDRGCGSAAQLGFQYARGERLLLLDGDMELAPDFLPAANAALDTDPTLAGVGGLVVDRVLTLEFQRRNQQHSPNAQPGLQKHLNGGGLFRMEALRQSGYLTDRNLHACEEHELGIRLRTLGWRFRRIGLPSVYHYGHATPPYRLLRNRWRTKYLLGQGELLRLKLQRPGWWKLMADERIYAAAIVWWALLLAVLAGLSFAGAPLLFAAVLLVLLAAPVALQWKRKGSLEMAIYSIALLNYHAVGMIVGLLRTRIDPMRPIDSVVLHPKE